MHRIVAIITAFLLGLMSMSSLQAAIDVEHIPRETGTMFTASTTLIASVDQIVITDAIHSVIRCTEEDYVSLLKNGDIRGFLNASVDQIVITNARVNPVIRCTEEDYVSLLKNGDTREFLSLSSVQNIVLYVV